MVVRAAGESTGGEQLASVGKQLLKAGGECIRGEFASLRIAVNSVFKTYGPIDRSVSIAKRCKFSSHTPGKFSAAFLSCKFTAV